MPDSASSENQPRVLSADKPLVDPQNDRLGYAPFAVRLADSIKTMAPPEGLTIAIYGPWGSGKTTLLNFVIHMPEAERPVVVLFNPWLFSGHEDLIRRFFHQLQVALTSKLKAAGKQLPRMLANLGDLVSEAPVPYASSGKILSRLFGSRARDVNELKSRIAEQLRRHRKRILVVIDDIDRLTSDEIRQLFRVVRAVADFPNVVYLLAFDKDVVTRALVAAQALPGEAYLEKIIQVPFELPQPDKTSVRRLLFERLDAILADTPDETFDHRYWTNVYLEGVDSFVTTPRDVVRLTNTLSVTYAHVKGEVNPVDFIAIEALRVFQPSAYDAIRKNPESFSGHPESGWLGADRTKEALRSFHDSWMKQLTAEVQAPLTKLLTRLFPKFESAFSNIVYDARDESDWRRELRVCSRDRFPMYFRLASPEGSIANSEMQAILSLAGDKDAFAERLIALAGQVRPDGTTRVRAFLELLEDYTARDIASKDIPSVVSALFDVGDELLRPEDERRGIFDFGTDTRIGRVLWQLLRRADEATRFQTLKEAMSAGRAISTIVREIAVLGQEHGKHSESRPAPEDERIVNSAHLQELEIIGLQKIHALAAQGRALLLTKQPLGILYRWRDWGPEQEVKEWVHAVIAEDSGLVTVLEQFVQKVLLETDTDVTPRRERQFNLKGLADFVELAAVIERVRGLTNLEEFTESQRYAVAEFQQAYNRSALSRPDDSAHSTTDGQKEIT